MSYRLVILSGPDKGKTIRVESGASELIGRGEAATARLSDPAVSRVHFELATDNESAFPDGQRQLEWKPTSTETKVDAMEVKSGSQISGGRYGDAFGVRAHWQQTQTMAAAPPVCDALAKNSLVRKLGSYQLSEIIGVGTSGMIFKGLDEEK